VLAVLPRTRAAARRRPNLPRSRRALQDEAPPPAAAALLAPATPDSPAWATGFSATFTLNEQIGQGTYAAVFRATHNSTRAQVAVKVVAKAQLAQQCRERPGARAAAEASLWRRLADACPAHVVGLHGTFEDPDNYIYVMVGGGAEAAHPVPAAPTCITAVAAGPWLPQRGRSPQAHTHTSTRTRARAGALRRARPAAAGGRARRAARARRGARDARLAAGAGAGAPPRHLRRRHQARQPAAGRTI
jgi:hypothetical protein